DGGERRERAVAVDDRALDGRDIEAAVRCAVPAADDVDRVADDDAAEAAAWRRQGYAGHGGEGRQLVVADRRALHVVEALPVVAADDIDRAADGHGAMNPARLDQADAGGGREGRERAIGVDGRALGAGDRG